MQLARCFRALRWPWERIGREGEAGGGW